MQKRSAKPALILFILVFFTSINLYAQQPPEEIKHGRFDTGKMWAFDFPPVEYLAEEYGFKPEENWFVDVRLAALRIPGCTASFVSEDGLIMTNNHCSDGPRMRIQKEGEDLRSNGYYAESLEDERKVDEYWAEQLVLIEDVTEEIRKAVESGDSKKEKVENKNKKIAELEKKYKKETGLRCKVYELFNGGYYSLYGFKRYEDIRMVFIPEEAIGYFGGDYDNFTYPRYNLDCTFYRIYEDGKPLKTEHFFKWSKDGAQKDEVLFTVGNPGRTNRLKTLAHLKFYKEGYYGNLAFLYDELYNGYEELKTLYPERAEEFELMKVDIGNAQKVLTRLDKHLGDPSLLARKKSWENELKMAIEEDPELKEKYSGIWDTIDRTRAELTEYQKKINAYKLSKTWDPQFYFIPVKLVELANELNLPEEKRKEEYQNENLEKTIANIFPEKFDNAIEKLNLRIWIDAVKRNLGDEDSKTKILTNGLSTDKAVDYLLSKTIVNDKEKVLELAKKGSDEILNSKDPFIKYVAETRDELKELEAKKKEVEDTESVYENLLGSLMYDVYGNSIPPDANFTLRLTDGVLKTFEYNGTIAQLFTNFYGLYERYYGFEKQYPWDLPERWKNPPAEFELSTPFNFVSTHDAVGGSSGSPVINKEKEIVGLAFDGNIKSIIGNFMYIEEENRNVSVASQGMIEALKHIYKADRLVKELLNGKMK